MQLSLSLRPRAVLAAIGAATVLALSSGCGAISDLTGSGDDAKRDEPGGQITESSEADVFSLKLGDCMNRADLTGLIDTVDAMPCTDPHDAEIYAEFEFPKGDFPGDAVFTEKADTFCYDEFATYMGISYDDSTLDMTYLTPTSSSWSGTDDRLLQCVVYTSGEPATASFKDSGL